MVVPLIRIQGVTKHYRMGDVEVTALAGIDLELMPGEFVVILGPSGSGKSTLLNIIGGLDTPTSGTVYYKEQALGEASERELTFYRRLHIGFVFQFYNLLSGLTAYENVALIAETAAEPLSAERALGLVGLAERMHHYPAQLSGGEQQRVAIARAISKRPDVLLCDEPTGALDVRTGILVLEAINQVNADLNTTVAVITHNATIAEMAHRVIQMKDGKIVEIQNNSIRKPPRDLVW